MSGFLVSSSAQEAVKQRDQSAVIVIRAPGRTQSSGMFLTLCGGNIARVGAARWLPTRPPAIAVGRMPRGAFDRPRGEWEATGRSNCMDGDTLYSDVSPVGDRIDERAAHRRGLSALAFYLARYTAGKAAAMRASARPVAAATIRPVSHSVEQAQRLSVKAELESRMPLAA